jgi:hypothetical protein
MLEPAVSTALDDEVVLREQVAQAGRFDVAVDMVGGTAQGRGCRSGTFRGRTGW